MSEWAEEIDETFTLYRELKRTAEPSANLDEEITKVIKDILKFGEQLKKKRVEMQVLSEDFKEYVNRFAAETERNMANRG